MSWYHPSSLLDRIFEAGLLLKGISGGLEAAAGGLLLFIDPIKLHSFIFAITQKELLQDPHDLVAGFLLHSSLQFTGGSRAFLIAYLWVHAAIKLVAVIGILRNQLWAYPFSLATLGLFMMYQVYELAVVPNLGLVVLTVFDAGIVWLIWREYGQAKQRLGRPPRPA